MNAGKELSNSLKDVPFLQESRLAEILLLKQEILKIKLKSTRRKKALRRMHLTVMEKNAIIARQKQEILELEVWKVNHKPMPITR